MSFYDVECPYCEAELNIPFDGEEQEQLYEHECPKCEKMFVYSYSISFDYTASKADCLNGTDHDYQKTNTYPPEMAQLRCTMCGDTKPLK